MIESEFEAKSKEVLQKVHDSALGAGLYTGAKAVKDILDKKNLSAEEKLKEISVFVNNAVNTLENKMKKGE